MVDRSGGLSVGFLVCRAALQAITIDEATTFELWVLPATPAYWDGASNNHILNSVLIKLFTSVFGLSHLTMRAAACLGGALFYAGICYLAHLLTPHRGLQWIFFVFAGSDPLILDYLVAARGYSLAMPSCLAVSHPCPIPAAPRGSRFGPIPLGAALFSGSRALHCRQLLLRDHGRRLAVADDVVDASARAGRCKPVAALGGNVARRCRAGGIGSGALRWARSPIGQPASCGGGQPRQGPCCRPLPKPRFTSPIRTF